MDLNKDNIKKIIFIIFCGILFYSGINHLSLLISIAKHIATLLLPILLGMCIAFILNVPMRAIERNLFANYHGKRQKLVQKIRRPLSFILTLLCVIGVIMIVIFVVTPEFIRTIQTIISSVPGFLSRSQKELNRLLNEYQWLANSIGDIEIDWNSLSSHLTAFLKSGVESIVSSTFGIASSVINSVITFCLGFFFAIYILFQKETLARQCRRLMYAYLPEKFVDRTIEVANLSCTTFSKFISGQCLEAVILGTMFFVVLTICRLPYALLIGVLISFTALIPIVGAFIGCFIGALLMLMVSPKAMIVFIIIFLLLQQIEGNFIYPKVVGNSVGLPPLWVLAAITVGGNLLGVIGMLIFIPLLSIIYTLLRQVVRVRLKKRNIRPNKIS